MDIHHRLTRQDSDALARAVAASGGRDAAWLTVGTVALFALSLALPLAASPEGLTRGFVAVLLAVAGGWIALGTVEAWRRQRARWVTPPEIKGLEPGERTLSLSLGSLREVGPVEDRTLRWRTFLDRVETPEWLALIVSDRECVAIPRSALNEPGLAEAETLTDLIGRGTR